MAEADPYLATAGRPLGAPRDNRLLYGDVCWFAAEMAALGERCWQYVALTDELATPNDWLRTQVFGVDLFVQNFGGTLRGFRNVCRHRGFPIRREARGNGPVICGFHAWRYGREGELVGVARNEELFGLSREDRADLALTPVRVATAGRFVFVAVSDATPPLADYLGRYRGLLETWSGMMGRVRDRWTGPVRANWKLSYEVTLDEYHVPFVHADSFGVGQIPRWGCVYEREGLHSHLLRRRTPDWDFKLWERAAAGEYETQGYKIHHLFPTALVVIARHLMLITHWLPEAPVATWQHDTMVDMDGGVGDDALWAQTAAEQRRISGEDREISEAQQAAIVALPTAPVLGGLEERVRWFHETYEAEIAPRACARLAGSA